MKFVKTGMLLQHTVVIIAALILILWSSVAKAGSIVNIAAEHYTTQSHSVRYSRVSNKVEFAVEPAHIIKIFPTSNVLALSKGESIVVSFDAKVYKRLKPSDSPIFSNNISFAIEKSPTEIDTVNWNYSWRSGATDLQDTLFINFVYYPQTRYTLQLFNLRDGLGSPISDTTVVFYTTLDYSQSAEVFRRDKLDGITLIDMPAYSVDDIGLMVLRISLPEEMIAADDNERLAVAKEVRDYVAVANANAEKLGLTVLDGTDYKFYRQFTLYQYDSAEGRWIDYFDSDADNLPDTGKVFKKKVYIQIPYSDDYLGGKDVAGLRLYRLTYSSRTGEWYWTRISTSRVNEDKKIVYAYVDHFSVYSILFNAPPAATKLYQNYPNPFNPDIDGVTKIDFDLYKPGYVTAQIFTIMGELVRTLCAERFFDSTDRYWFTQYSDAPESVLRWDGKNDYGKTVSSGVYVLRFVVKYKDGSSPYKAYRKIVVVR